MQGQSKPNKTDHQGDQINYPDDCGTPTTYLLTVKIFITSMNSTPNAKFMTMDIKNFYLNAPLKGYKYFHLKLEDIPVDVRQEYKLMRRSHQKIGCMSKYAKECMAYCKQGY